MLCQTVDELTPFLSLLQQPAFCIRQDGSLQCNRAAYHIAPIRADSLPAWLGSSVELFEQWDQQNTLQLTISPAGHPCSVTIQALKDGLLFLLQPCEGILDRGSLQVAAQVLRQPLTSLFAVTQQFSDDLVQRDDPLLAQTASINRHLYRLSRTLGNLADLELLQNDRFQPQKVLTELRTYLTPLLEELEHLTRSCGHVLEYTLPVKATAILVDPSLLERGLLNLLSNAIKFGSPITPIRFWTEQQGNHVLLRLRNACDGDHTELLRAAFSRLDQRDVLPDPRWGVGIGLPLTQTIARLHGGTVAVEVSADGFATVTMALDRRRPLTQLQVKTPVFDYAGGLRRTLVELSDVLPNEVFDYDAI